MEEEEDTERRHKNNKVEGSKRNTKQQDTDRYDRRHQLQREETQCASEKKNQKTIKGKR